MLKLLCIVLIVIKNVYANKYCSYELNGEPKYFICARNEYCCNFGCCVHLAFQFYQLWYYWLLLIFMFMICSGGSWWYKFCRQNERSNYPSIPQAVQRSARQNLADAQARRARALNRVAIDSSSFYLQRIWKTNGVTPPPNYYTGSVVRYHSSPDIESRRQQQECPYYQLYGPPPSYESVVRISERSRGRTSCVLYPPASPSALQQPQLHQSNDEAAIDSPSTVIVVGPSTSSAVVPTEILPLSSPSTSQSPSISSSPSSSPSPQSSSGPNTPTSPSYQPNQNSNLNSQMNPLPSTSELSGKFNQHHHFQKKTNQPHHHHQLHYQPLIHNRNIDEDVESIQLESSIRLVDRQNSRTATTISTATSTELINETGTRV